MKKLLFALFLCCTLLCAAQTPPVQRDWPCNPPMEEKNQFEDDMMRNAPIVIHGRLLKSKAIANSNLFSQLVAVSHTYRGDTQSDTVEIIFTSDAYFRQVDNILQREGGMHSCKRIEQDPYIESIFFCKPSEQPKKHRQSKAVLEMYATNQNGYSMAQGVGKNGGRISSGIRKSYYPNAKAPELRNEEFWYKLYNQPNIRLLPAHKGIYGSTTPTSTMQTPTLTIIQSAETVTNSGNNSFVEFDILVSGSEYLRLFNAQLQYDTFAIKPNLTIGTDLIVTKGTAFGSVYNIPSTWVKPPTGTRTINLQVSSNGQSGSTGWTAITTTPQVLLHVKIKLKPNACTGGNLVTFNTAYTDTQKCLYYTSSGTMYGSNALAYATTYPNNKTLNSTPCGGLIHDFFPKKLRAGFGDTLTIIGQGFGQQRGSGDVKFVNATEPIDLSQAGTHIEGYFYTPRIEDGNILKWTDDTVRLIIPSSFCEEAEQHPVVGSGRFVVIDSSGIVQDTSDAPLFISYAVIYDCTELNGVVTPVRKYFANTNCLKDTLEIYVNNLPSLNTAGYKTVLDSATYRWQSLIRQQMGLPRFTIKMKYVQNAVDTNLINYISFASYPSTSDILADTEWKHFLSERATRKNTRDTVGIALKTNMVINTNQPYDFSISGDLPPDKYGLYNTLIHEFGHFLGLDHALDTSQHLAILEQDLMLFATSIGGTSEDRRTPETGNGQALEGMKNIFTDNKNAVWNNMPYLIGGLGDTMYLYNNKTWLYSNVNQLDSIVASKGFEALGRTFPKFSTALAVPYTDTLLICQGATGFIYNPAINEALSTHYIWQYRRTTDTEWKFINSANGTSLGGAGRAKAKVPGVSSFNNALFRTFIKGGCNGMSRTTRLIVKPCSGGMGLFLNYLNGLPIVAGSTKLQKKLGVHFSSYGTLPANTTYTIQASKTTSFQNPLILGTYTGTADMYYKVITWPNTVGGCYYVRVISSNGLVSNVKKLYVQDGVSPACNVLTNGLNKTELEETSTNYTLYPNPTNKTLWVASLHENPVEVHIFAPTGVEYMHFTMTGNLAIDTEELPSGTYFIRFSDDTGVETQSFTVNH